MKTDLAFKSTRALPVAASLLAATVTASMGASVMINENRGAVAGAEEVAGAKLRASNNAWDQGLSNGFGYTDDDAVKTDVAGNFRNPGGRTFTFSFEHRAGEGFVFSVTGDGQTTTQAWGTFSNAPGGSVVATLGGEVPNLPFDALEIEARSTLRGASVTFSNFVFNSPDLDVSSGAFYDGTVNRTTRIPGNGRGVATQNLLADANLGAYSWSLTGEVTFERPRGNSGAEDVRLTIAAKNVSAPLAAAPEPASTALVLLCGGLILARRQRA